MNKQIDIIDTIISEIKTCEDFKNAPLKNISRVHITVTDKNVEWLAKITPISSNNDIYFELFLQSSVVDDLFSRDNSKLYLSHYNFILKIIPYMDTLYQAYPDWVSEEKFLMIGKKLFSIIHNFNITYSTSDLSDNFVFVPIK